jgi:hypothetical protein
MGPQEGQIIQYSLIGAYVNDSKIQNSLLLFLSHWFLPITTGKNKIFFSDQLYRSKSVFTDVR